MYVNVQKGLRCVILHIHILYFDQINPLSLSVSLPPIIQESSVSSFVSSYMQCVQILFTLSFSVLLSPPPSTRTVHYIYIYINIYIHIWIHTYIYIHIHIYAIMYVFMCMFIFFVLLSHMSKNMCLCPSEPGLLHLTQLSTVPSIYQYT
jgi:hypothetical protein